MDLHDPLGISLNPKQVEYTLPTTREKLPLLEPVPDHPDEYILRIDNSSLEKIDTCQRSAEYYLVNRRTAISGAALAYGGALHKALEIFYKTGDMNAGITAAVDRYSSTILRPDEWRTSDFLVHTLTLYHRQYFGNDITPLAANGEPLVEIPFSLPLGILDLDETLPYTRRQLLGDKCDRPDELLYIKRLHVLWSGKIDMIISHVGSPTIVDHKTTSMEGDSFYNQFYLSQPVHGYAWAAEQILGQPINDFLLNAIIMRKPTKTGTSNNFIRRRYAITESNKSEFVADVMSKITTFVHNLIEGYFPKSPAWCQGKYGQCPYFSVCNMDSPNAKAILLATDTYENVTWSPLSDD